MNATTATLSLDSESISPDELSLSALMRELNLQKRPSWILSKLMNALEKKRQARGMGWSRPWNKIGLNVFRTHTQDTNEDADYFSCLKPLINSLLQEAPVAYREFAEELQIDSKLMVFTFYHNHDIDGIQYEGLTLSLGRKVESDPSKRDRLDLILEDRRVDGRVDGLIDRLRLYVCPWSEYQNDKRHFALDIYCSGEALKQEAQAFYEESVRRYHKWKDDEDRQWSHWSASFIDYFGPRSFIPVGTSFS